MGLFTNGMFYLSLCFRIAIVESPISHLYLPSLDGACHPTFPLDPIHLLRSPCSFVYMCRLWLSHVYDDVFFPFVLCVAAVSHMFSLPFVPLRPSRSLYVSLVVVPNGFLTGIPSRGFASYMLTLRVGSSFVRGHHPREPHFFFHIIAPTNKLTRSSQVYITISLVKMSGDRCHFYPCASHVCCLILHHAVCQS